MAQRNKESGERGGKPRKFPSQVGRKNISVRGEAHDRLIGFCGDLYSVQNVASELIDFCLSQDPAFTTAVINRHHLHGQERLRVAFCGVLQGLTRDICGGGGKAAGLLHDSSDTGGGGGRLIQESAAR